MKKLSLLLTSVVLLAVVSGCAGQKTDAPQRTIPVDKNLVSQSYDAADHLLDQVPWLKANRQALLTGTIVNVNSVEDSSALGRIIAEQISSRFAQQGFSMIELKMRRNVYIKEQGGEFMLSRAVRNVSQTHNAAAVIAGTYAVARRNVYVSARLIRAADNLVIAAHDYILPMGPDTRALLASQ